MCQPPHYHSKRVGFYAHPPCQDLVLERLQVITKPLFCYTAELLFIQVTLANFFQLSDIFARSAILVLSLIHI